VDIVIKTSLFSSNSRAGATPIDLSGVADGAWGALLAPAEESRVRPPHICQPQVTGGDRRANAFATTA
jgi:hypothetical protein